MLLGKVQVVEFFFQEEFDFSSKVEYYSKESSHKCSVSPLAVLFVPKLL
jgi:hypothetical protein